MLRPFRGRRGGNQIVACSTTSVSATVDASAQSVRIFNPSGQIAYVRIGAGAQTATSGDTPVANGASIILSKGDGENTVAILLAASTGNVHVQDGEGGL